MGLGISLALMIYLLNNSGHSGSSSRGYGSERKRSINTVNIAKVSTACKTKIETVMYFYI